MAKQYKDLSEDEKNKQTKALRKIAQGLDILEEIYDHERLADFLYIKFMDMFTGEINKEVE